MVSSMRMGFELKYTAMAIRGALHTAALVAGCAALAGCATMPDLGAKPALRDPATLAAVVAFFAVD